jgi:hypothetical protein
MILLTCHKTPCRRFQAFGGVWQVSHIRGKGTWARLLEVITQAGLSFQLAKTWQGTCKSVHALKIQKNAPRFCPVRRAKSQPLKGAPGLYTLAYLSFGLILNSERKTCTASLFSALQAGDRPGQRRPGRISVIRWRTDCHEAAERSAAQVISMRKPVRLLGIGIIFFSFNCKVTSYKFFFHTDFYTSHLQGNKSHNTSRRMGQCRGRHKPVRKPHWLW